MGVDMEQRMSESSLDYQQSLLSRSHAQRGNACHEALPHQNTNRVPHLVQKLELAELL